MWAYLRVLLCLAAPLMLFGPSAGAEPVKLQMDWSPDFTHAGVYAAIDQGYFKDAGLEVELLDGQGGSNAVQLVGAGQADVGWASIGTMAFGRGNGVPLVAIAQWCVSEYAMIVPKGVTSMDALIGKKIVSTAQGGAAPFLEPFLAATGHKRDEFEIVIVDNSALFSTYATGKADALLSGFVSAIPEVESLRPSDSITFKSVGLNLPGYGLFVTEKTLKEKPEMLAKLVPAILKGWQYVFNGHEADAVDAIFRARPNDKLEPQRDTWIAEIKLMRQIMNGLERKDFGSQSESDWATALKTMVQSGLIKSAGNPSDYYTNQFIPH